MIGLSAVVVFTVLLPLAGASAGPAGSEGEGPDLAEGGPAPVPADQQARQTRHAQQTQQTRQTRLAQQGAENLSGQPAADSRVGAKAPTGAGTDPLSDGRPAPARAQCGPEVASPDGVEAQTCVLTEDRDTWARTYYRNATGRELDAVLSLMGPAGRTVQMHCAVAAEDEPGSCETPHETGSGPGAEPERYTAVAEFASPQEGPLLLRSGSNSAAPAAR